MSPYDKALRYTFRMAKSISLSKSRITLGLQCPKALYLKVHSPELAPEVSAGQQKLFDQGHEVGVEARKRYPGGVLIDAPYYAQDKAVAQTLKAISDGALAIYEATFLHADVVVKIDILNRKNLKSAWEIVEVKSATSIKDQYLADAAIQYWAATGSGLKVKSTSIMHINNQGVFPNLEDLFTFVDISAEVLELQPDLPDQIDEFRKILKAKSPPKLDIGNHCSSPYDCAFTAHCWSHVPSPSVFDIPRLGKSAWQLYEKKILKLQDVDTNIKFGKKGFSAIQKRMIEHTISKKRFIDSKQVAKELNGWSYPLSVLDFETIMYAIPKYEGTSPYQQMPFQFSCHIVSRAGAKPTHTEYLHTENSDPRRPIAEALVELVPTIGSVVAYNKGFENGVLTKMSKEFPKLRKALLSIAERLVDPLPIFQQHIYDHAFGGSFSLKAVAPAILGDTASYSDLEVGDGNEAQAAFVEMIAPKTSASRKAEIEQDLVTYCRQDTQVCVDLISWLNLQASK